MFFCGDPGTENWQGINVIRLGVKRIGDCLPFALIWQYLRKQLVASISPLEQHRLPSTATCFGNLGI